MNFSDDAIGDYDRVGRIASMIRPPKLESYTPQITKRDRSLGEINRYFARFTTHTSPADITEVSKVTYTSLKKNPLYQTVQIRWKISGKLDDEFGLPNINTPVRLYTGVVTANTISTQLANEKLLGLTSYITDYKRFWEE
jgi:hypothetical protein